MVGYPRSDEEDTGQNDVRDDVLYVRNGKEDGQGLLRNVRKDVCGNGKETLARNGEDEPRRENDKSRPRGNY